MDLRRSLLHYTANVLNILIRNIPTSYVRSIIAPNVQILKVITNPELVTNIFEGITNYELEKLI